MRRYPDARTNRRVQILQWMQTWKARGSARIVAVPHLSHRNSHGTPANTPANLTAVFASVCPLVSKCRPDEDHDLPSKLSLSVFAFTLPVLAGCILDEQRLPQSYTPTVAVPRGATLVTVNTTPDGAFCYLQGYRSSIYVQQTPAPMVVPAGFEERNLICELEGSKPHRVRCCPDHHLQMVKRSSSNGSLFLLG